MVFSFSIPRFYQVSLRGAAPSVHPSALPKVGAQPPRPPWGGRSAPPTPGLLRGWQPLHPPAGAPREHGFAMLGTRVTFPTRGKSPKARQGLRPLESPGAKFPPSLVLHYACTRAAFSHYPRPICHFEWVGKLVLFSPRVLPGKHFRMLSRGTVVAPRMLEGFICSKQYR